MSIVKHSPKKGLKLPSTTAVEQSQSVPNITQAISDPELINVTRYKRLRTNDSHTSYLDDFKLEIKQMLTTWKRDYEDAFSKALAEQTSLVAKLVTEVTELKQQNLDIQKSNKEIEKSITTISELYDDMNNKVKLLQSECRNYKKYTEVLEKTVRDLQYQSRSSTIEIRNVPLKPNESAADLTNIITNIGSTVDLPISPTAIRDVYRASGNSPNKAIIAELTSVQIKTELISRVRKFNTKHESNDHKLNTQLIGLPGQKHPVYVDEHLCSSVKKLFYLCRQFAKQHDYKFCWSSNGRIFLRKQPGDKQILIKSETTLQELQDSK
ncbi:unnamed protein product [Arctia plantaginis]|uniref:FP protein C-terminal domain-containing protein n=1 Tax=Arctia plantaginis TaxID=874455 RepID=A0A8S1AHR9_ARCPL|nr:unnamed protein product [Arctia plantaginis]